MPVNVEHPPAQPAPIPTGLNDGHPAITDPGHLLPEHASESKRSGGGGLRLLIILLILAAAIGLIIWRISANQKQTAKESDRAAAAARRATPVSVVPVQQRTVPVYLTALGTVTAYNTVTLHTRVDGQLLQVNFQEGQSVRKGQMLLQIDPRPYQATVDQAVGTLAKDEANLHNMEAEAQRYTALYQAGVVSKEQQQLQVSNQGQAAGTIKADQAAIEAAKVNLGYTRIVSPIDGVVGLRQVDPGNIVHAADTTGLVVITQIHPIAIIFTLPEDQLPQVQAAMKGGKKLVVEAYDRSDAHKLAAGTLLTIDNQIDTTTGTAKLKAVFENTDNALFTNQFVNVRLILRDRQNATVVPTAAIQSGSQGSFVFVVNPGPTPKDKLKNQPGYSAGTTSDGGHHGGQGGGRSGKASGSGEAGSTASSDDADSSQAAAGSHGGKPRAQYHADQVSVHVDMTLGTSSVLTDGELKPGQQVVIDGAEKLVDGGNVAPQPARYGAGTGNRPNGAIGSSGASPSGSPQQPGGVNNGTSDAATPAGNGQTGATGAAPAGNGSGSSHP